MSLFGKKELCIGFMLKEHDVRNYCVQKSFCNMTLFAMAGSLTTSSYCQAHENVYCKVYMVHPKALKIYLLDEMQLVSKPPIIHTSS